MALTRYWDGTSNTAISTKASWLIASSGATNAAAFTGDSLYIDQRAVSNGTGDLGDVAADVHISRAFTKYLGTSTTPVTVQCSRLYVGEDPAFGTGSGSGRLNLHTGANTDVCSVTVISGASASADTNKEPIRIGASSGTSSSQTDINVLGGTVGIGTNYYGEAVKIKNVSISGGIANLGSGVDLQALQQSGGTVYSECAIPAATVEAGTFTSAGNYAITTLNAYSGTVTLRHRKTAAGDEVGTLNLYQGAVIDLSSDPAAFAVGTINVYGEARIITCPANRGHFSWTTLNRYAELVIE